MADLGPPVLAATFPEGTPDPKRLRVQGKDRQEN